MGEPLRLARVAPGSPAARIGLREGDEVTEIDNTPANRLTYARAIDLIDRHADSLLLTIERKARGSIPANHVLYSSAEQNHQKPYQTLDMTGSNQPSRTATQRHCEYQYAESRSFDAPAKRPHQLLSQPQSSPYLPPTNTDYSSTRIDSDAPFYHQQQQPEFQQQPQQLSPTDPQSRTFKMLRSVMENDEPHAGVAGLPPPRSAAMEQMKREGSSQRPPSFPAPLPASYSSSPSGSRVKVFMPQKYNSPLAMYSADNVLETFTSQAENLLSNLERKQNYGPELEPLFSSDFL